MKKSYELSSRSVAASELSTLQENVNVGAPSMSHVVLLECYDYDPDESLIPEMAMSRINVWPQNDSEHDIAIFRQDGVPLQAQDATLHLPPSGSPMLKEPLPVLGLTRNPDSGLWVTNAELDSIVDLHAFECFINIVANNALAKQHRIRADQQLPVVAA